MRSMKSLVVQILIAAALLSGCASVPERNPVPEELVDVAVSPVSKFARMWGDALPADVERRQSLMKQQMQDSSG